MTLLLFSLMLYQEYELDYTDYRRILRDWIRLLPWQDEGPGRRGMVVLGRRVSHHADPEHGIVGQGCANYTHRNSLSCMDRHWRRGHSDCRHSFLP